MRCEPRKRTIQTEYRDTEVKLRAAIGAGDDERVVSTEDAEARAMRVLCGRASVGRVLSAIVEKRNTDGAELELQQAHGLAPNQFPFEMLRGHGGTPAVEHRGLTPAPSSVETDQDQIVQPVFAMGAGAFLKVYRPTVEMGDAVYPVLTSRPAVGGPHTDDSDVVETTGAFDADLLAPGRIQASFLWKRTDAARFPALDESLRSALSMGLEEKADKEIVSGANGLLTGTNLANHNVSAVTTFALYMSHFIYGRVDGRYATDAAMLRTVVGADTYAHMGSVYRANNVDVPAAQIINARTGGVRVSTHVPDVASNKQNAVIRLGSRRDLVQPMWRGVTLIVDEVTLSGKGEIEVTAVQLLATKIIRAGGFYKAQTQHA